ncbi:MAG: glutamate--cysteine ligase, partial [Rhodoferax sp.]|nr:glutamate--cysteine ligase [Rhodoferax sp.]
ECLRVDPQGSLAQTRHPPELGSKLVHPWITTDYAEALLEFITPPSQDPDFPLQFLDQIHRFVAARLPDELMWAGSMPCRLGNDLDIPIADYGSSNQARFKQVYRTGLWHRYGRHMQTIAGAHYNWSLPMGFWQLMQDSCPADQPERERISASYFGLIRNFLRYSWLIPYLFGASPALDDSFLQGRTSDLASLPGGTLYGPYATSLRMSDLGYQNRAQANLNVSFDSLEAYTAALETAIRTPDPYYQAVGLRQGDEWLQLNTNLLQIENEFYAPMRPKRIGRSGERPAKALALYGVEYVELRLFDLNPELALGIAPEQARFADTLLLMCLFRDSPPISCREQAENDENKSRVATRGRLPGLRLLAHNREQPMRPLAHQLFDDMQPYAGLLDLAYGGSAYQDTLSRLRERVDHPELTPSAQVLEGVLRQGSFLGYTLNCARKHHAQWLDHPLSEPEIARFEAQTAASIAAHHAAELRDNGPFEDYLARYFA